MQFAGQTPPTYIIVLFVTFFPLQGFFNLIVYMFPRILRYLEDGIPLTQPFQRRRSSFSFLSTLVSSARNSISKRKASQVSFADGIVEEVDEVEMNVEMDVDMDTEADVEADVSEENIIEDATIVEIENVKSDREKDSVDELEHILEA